MVALSVNQRLPSGPFVIPVGRIFVVGSGNSVTFPAGVTRPIKLWLVCWLGSELVPASVNQRLPSGPLVIAIGKLNCDELSDTGIVNSVTWPAGPAGVFFVGAALLVPPACVPLPALQATSMNVRNPHILIQANLRAIREKMLIESDPFLLVILPGKSHSGFVKIPRSSFLPDSGQIASIY